MAASDPVDDTAMIFTEGDVYMIGGYLAEIWDAEGDSDERTEDIEEAIMTVLNHEVYG